MKRFYLLYILLLALVCPAVHGQYALISAHQEWAEKYYANPDLRATEELAVEAALIITYNLQESQALNLLETLAANVPELKGYCSMRHRGDIDTLFNNTVTALKGIADFMESTHPESFNACLCRYYEYNSRNNVQDIDSEWERLIRRQEKILKKTPSAENRALHSMMRAQKLIAANVRRCYNDPLEIPLIFDIEKEALEAFPIDSDVMSPLRAALYYQIAELKTFVESDIMSASIYGSLSGNKEIPQYLVSGHYGIPFLYNKAAEIARNCYNEGHPFVHAIMQSEVQYRMNTSYSEQANADSKREYDYVKAYFPVNSSEIANTRVMYCLDAFRRGISTNDDLFLNSDMNTLEAYIGASNPIYYTGLFQVVAAFAAVDPDNPDWSDRLKAAMSKAGISEDSDVMHIFHAKLILHLYQVRPDEAKQLMEQQLEKYRLLHAPTMSSIQVGSDMQYFYQYCLYNNAIAIELNTIINNDFKKILGSKAAMTPFWWSRQLSSAAIAVNDNNTLADSIYAQMVKILDLQKDYPEKPYIRLSVLSEWATGKISVNNVAETVPLLEECVRLASRCNNKDDEFYCLANLAVIKQQIGAPADETDILIDRAAGILRNNPEGTVQCVSVTPMITYYLNYANWQAALEASEKQLRLYELQYDDAYTNDLISMRSVKADILERLDRHNEASRVRSENEELVARQFRLNPSPEMLDILWDNYYKIRNNNLYDYNEIYARLNNIVTTTTALYNYAGQPPRFLYSYGLRAISELIYVQAYIWDFVCGNFQELPADQQEKYQEMMQNYENQVNPINELVPVLEDLLKKYKASDSDYRLSADYNNALHHLAAYYRLVKQDADKAIALCREIYENKTFPEDRFSAASDLMYLCSNAGMADEARRYAAICEELLPECESLLSDGPKADLRRFRMEDFCGRGDYDSALPYARELYHREKEILDGNFQFMTTKEQEDYMTRNGDPAWPLTVMLRYMPEQLAGECYDAVTYRTGMQLRSQRATREAIARSSDPAVKMLNDSLSLLRAQFKTHQLSMNPLASPDENSAFCKKSADFTHRINRVEQKLLDMTASLRSGSVADVSWQSIRDRLARDEAAVEFVYAADRLMALVLKKGCASPIAVDLCANADLAEKLSRKGKNSAAFARNLYRKDDTSVYDLIWRNLEPAISGITTVYYTMPGILSAVALNAVYTPDGKPLFDKYDLVQLTTTAQLVFDNPAPASDRIAMMGDILYSPKQKILTPTTPGVREVDEDFVFDGGDYTDDGEGRSLVSTSFRYLPFTAVELDSITGLFPDDKVDTVRRHNASERRLREMVAGHPAILHLATHGFYITSDRDLTKHPFFSKHGSGSMQRSGVALADAELAWRGSSSQSDDNDGILTADEIAGLSLGETGLVTLSACETALGDFSYEGVFGLQRGFKQAGVKSLLVSLWSVNDFSTALFMTTFYSSLRGGETLRKSWRHAVKTVREKYPQPYYWASFILLDGR